MFLSGAWHPTEKCRPTQKVNIARINPFLEDGFIRLGGRLQLADLSEASRHPLLLDGKHHFLTCWFGKHVRLHHMRVGITLSELREEFCLLRARQAIKKVLHKCLPCKMAKNPAANKLKFHFQPTGYSPKNPLRSQELTSLELCISRWGVTWGRVTTPSLHVLPHVQSTWNYAPIWPLTSSCWQFSDLWEDGDCHTPPTRTTHGPFTLPTKIWLYYGPLCPQPKLTNSSLKITLLGSLSPRGQLGGEDGGKGWSGPRNAAYVRYWVDSRSLKKDWIPLS